MQQLTPLHAAPLLRPGVDLVLLPDRPAVREYWGFIAQLMGLSEDQVCVWGCVWVCVWVCLGGVGGWGGGVYVGWVGV